MLDDKSRHILEWIAPMNFSIAHIDITSQRREKFGEWFLETAEYKDWLGGVSQILFCKGIPGAGKTYLASLIIDHLRGTLDETVGMAWAYCNYTERKSQSTLKLTSSLLRQLAQGLGDIPRNIQDLYEAHSSGQVPLRLSEVKQALMSIVTAYDRVFLVVDALDECDDTNGTRDTFTEELLALPAHVQILVTSRPIKNIEDEFSRSTHIEIRAQDDDIKNYVNLRVRAPQFSLFGSLRFNVIFSAASRGSEFKETCTIRYRLAESHRRGRCRAMSRHVSDTNCPETYSFLTSQKMINLDRFLMAKLHLDSLARKAKYHKNAVLKMINQLPHELDTTYQNAMERVLDQETDESELAKRVLLWVWQAFEPLNIRQLQEANSVAMGEPHGDVDSHVKPAMLTSVCAGLVEVEESGTLRLVHFTAADFFFRHSQEYFQDRSMYLSFICLKHVDMSSSDADRKDLVFDELEEEYEWMVGQRADPSHQRSFMTYAVPHLKDHLRYQPGPLGDPLLFQAIKDAWGHFTHSLSGFYAYITGSGGFESEHLDFFPDLPDDLQIAAYFGYHVEVEHLLRDDSSEEENQVTLDKGAAACIAAYRGDDEILRVLLEAKADVSSTFGQWTPLEWAIAKENLTTIQLLFYFIHDLGSFRLDGKEILIPFAIIQNPTTPVYQPIIEILLEQGADINGKDTENRAALHCAISIHGGKDSPHVTELISIINLLISHGADINQESNGSTPLAEACRHGLWNIARLLLERGVDVNKGAEVTPFYNTCFYPYQFNDSMECMDMATCLLDHGADPNKGSKTTPLIRACKRKDMELVSFLLEKGADVNKIPDMAMIQSPIYTAYAWEHGTVLNLSPQLEGPALRHNPLLAACTMLPGSKDIVKLLVDRGADVNCGVAQTPLFTAADQRDIETVKLLLAKGADPHNAGIDPYNHWTTCHFPRYVPIIQVLIEAGAVVDERFVDTVYCRYHRINRVHRDMPVDKVHDDRRRKQLEEYDKFHKHKQLNNEYQYLDENSSEDNFIESIHCHYHREHSTRRRLQIERSYEEYRNESLKDEDSDGHSGSLDENSHKVLSKADCGTSDSDPGSDKNLESNLDEDPNDALSEIDYRYSDSDSGSHSGSGSDSNPGGIDYASKDFDGDEYKDGDEYEDEEEKIKYQVYQPSIVDILSAKVALGDIHGSLTSLILPQKDRDWKLDFSPLWRLDMREQYRGT